jgi:hypothetical protein
LPVDRNPDFVIFSEETLRVSATELDVGDYSLSFEA